MSWHVHDNSSCSIIFGVCVRGWLDWLWKRVDANGVLMLVCVWLCIVLRSCVWLGGFYFLSLGLNLLYFFGHASHSSLDYYLDLCPFTERHISFLLSLHYSLCFWILFSLSVIHSSVIKVQTEARGTLIFIVSLLTSTFDLYVFVELATSVMCLSFECFTRWSWGRRWTLTGDVSWRCSWVVKSVVRRASGSCSWQVGDWRTDGVWLANRPLMDVDMGAANKRGRGRTWVWNGGKKWMDRLRVNREVGKHLALTRVWQDQKWAHLAGRRTTWKRWMLGEVTVQSWQLH